MRAAGFLLAGGLIFGSAALAQTVPQVAPGEPLNGDVFALEGSEWAPTVLGGDALIASGFVGGEVFVDVGADGWQELGFTRVRLRPMIHANGHYLSGIVLQTPPRHYVENFGCDPLPVRIGRIEGCFERDLMSIRAVIHLEQVTAGHVCEPMRTPAGATIPADGRPAAYSRTSPPGAPAAVADTTVASLDLRGLADFVSAVIDAGIRNLDALNPDEIRTLNLRVGQATARLGTLPIPLDGDIQDLMDYLGEKLTAARDRLAERPELRDLPAELQPGATPLVCLLDPPRACSARDADPDFLNGAASLNAVLYEVARSHDALPTELLFQDRLTGAEVRTILEQMVANRGPDDWLRGLRLPGTRYARLLTDLQRFARFSWCEDAEFLRLEREVNALLAEATAQHATSSRLLAVALEREAYFRGETEYFLDTWTEWTVFESLFGVDLPVTAGSLDSVFSIHDVLRAIFDLEPPDPYVRLSVQALEHIVGLISWGASLQPLIEVPAAAEAGASTLQFLKSMVDITLALNDMIRLSRVGNWTGEQDPEELLPSYLRFSEQAAYLSQLDRRNLQVLEAVTALHRDFDAERARRF